MNAKLGRESDAEKVLKELRTERQSKYVSGFFVSRVCIGLGKNEKAVQWLDAYQQKDYQLSWINVDPVFDPVRSDPRVPDLVRRADPQ